ncbi:MFS transporter [Alkalibacillus salilacus]|uniref:Sugar phosphate permease n=1 Tax=Alkalibacillus salilacus TaxID=284582 RepID=A0ABT9VB12_9BACI|nr:MFS transporter [Alkalibacillus salilacus]MDQ0158158.1 sugar phosphate permease [Alkalibacillus salilacus]
MKLNPWRLLALLFILQILVSLIGRSISPLGILIEEDLNLTKAQIGLLPTAFFIGQSTVSILAGILSDRIGFKVMFLIVSLTISSAFMATTFSYAFSILILCIFIGGAAYGAMHPATNKGIMYWFPKHNLGTAMGIKQTGVTTGSALGALIMLPLANMYGWRVVLFVACLILIIYSLSTINVFPKPEEDEDEQGGKKDIIKNLTQVVQKKSLLLVSISAACLSAGQMIVNTYIVFYSFEYLGYALVVAGLALVVSEIFGSLGRILWGIISDKIFQGDRIIVLMIVAVVGGVMASTLAFIPAETPFWVTIIFIAFLGFTVSGFNGIWMIAAAESVPKQFSGVSSGVSLTIGTLGVIIGPPVYGLLVDQTGGFMWGWIYFAGLMATVLGVLMVAKRVGFER